MQKFQSKKESSFWVVLVEVGKMLSANGLKWLPKSFRLYKETKFSIQNPNVKRIAFLTGFSWDWENPFSIKLRKLLIVLERLPKNVRFYKGVEFKRKILTPKGKQFLASFCRGWKNPFPIEFRKLLIVLERIKKMFDVSKGTKFKFKIRTPKG